MEYGNGTVVWSDSIFLCIHTVIEFCHHEPRFHAKPYDIIEFRDLSIRDDNLSMMASDSNLLSSICFDNLTFSNEFCSALPSFDDTNSPHQTI